MQVELNAVESDLDISIIAVNESGYGTPSNYELTGEKGSLRVLQDVNEVDAWGLWEAVYRDVIILNECGEKMGILNLSPVGTGEDGTSGLETPEIYDQLKTMIIEVAQRE